MRRKTEHGSKTDGNESSSMDADDLISLLTGGAPPPTNQEQRLVMLHGEVNESSTAQIIGQLLWLAGIDQERPIHLVISTYGGSVDEMFSIYDTIKYVPCPVHTLALGKVMSAGVLLLAAGTKGERLIGKSSRIMMHGLRGGAEGSVFEVMNSANEQQRQFDQVVEALASETRMSDRRVRQIMTMRHDHYVTAQDAIKMGIADRIMGK